jgi:ribosomal protein L29
MSEKDLNEKTAELRLEMSKETASAEIGGTVKSPGKIREIRRTIARIKTHRSEKRGVKKQ